MSTNDSEHSLASKSAVVEAAPELPQGSKIDRYVVLGILGKGGMGVVYKAYDPRLNRGVALKLIRARQDDQGSCGSARLLREAQALAQLNHPNVVSVHDVGTVEGNVFVAMELVPGKTLRAWRKATKPSTREVLEVMRAAGQGLAAAHRAALIHRDFKPDNVIVGEDGRVRVIDFGLARAGDAEPSAAIAPHRDIEEIEASETRVLDKKISRADDTSEPPLSSSSRDLLSTPLTRAGSIVGTPLYMAPEQHLGARVDACADQFSYCAVFYEVLYGKRPFPGGSLQEIVEQVRHGRVRPPPAESNVPKWLQSIVMRGLSLSPGARYPSMEVLLEELREDPREARRERQAVRRRKMLVLGSVVVVVCGPIGAWYGIKYQRARRCAAVETRLGGVWDGATKERIRMAFLGTKKSFAAGTWQRVERAFDTYTAEWTHMRAEACEATWLRGTQSEEVFDLRMSCLSKRIGELGALVKVFATADAGVVQKAAQASSSLAGIAICADEEALRAPIPPPKTAEAKTKVAAIRESLSEVVAFERTGKYRQGLEQVQKLEEQATAVAYRPVHAETLYWHGYLLERAGEYKKAETTLHVAARAAARSRDGLLAAKAMAGLVRVVGYRQARYEEGSSLAQAAEVVLGVAGGDERVRANLLKNRGSLFTGQGKFDKALEHLRKALAIKEKVLGPDHPDVSETLNSLGVVYYQMSKHDEALEYWGKSMAIQEKVLGPDHPDVAMSLSNMGGVFYLKGEHDKALEYWGKSMAIREKVLGPEHPDVAMSLSNLGVAFEVQSEYDKALECHRKALAIWETALGPEHPDVAMTLNNLGVVFWRQGESDKALEHLRKALAIQEKVLGPEHPGVAHSLSNMGLVYWKNGKYDKALEYLRKALAIWETALGPEHPLVAESLSGIGKVFVDQERPQQAIGALERAVRICDKKACQPEPRGWGLFAFARALVATNGDNERAIRLARQARELLGKAPYLRKNLEEIDAWLKERGVE